MKKMQKGFSLVELMVVIAIIAILAAVAVPMYSNYTDRARISGEIGQLSSAKSTVSEALMSGNALQTPINGATVQTSGTFATANDNAAAASLGAVSVASTAVSGATISLIPFQSGATTDSDIATLSANDNLQWTCEVSGGGITQSQLPSQCTVV